MWLNEIDAFAAQWLRNLFPSATVDERSIRDIGADDVVGRRCHFFAGIGGWELALQLAGWPEEREVWTGSCPCQPFSAAGKGKGVNDERHLWPDFYRLITERRPATVFGEQVASNLGRDWLAGVRADLEALGYAVGAADLCAASVGAPHIRQRLWWVADSQIDRASNHSEAWKPHTERDGNSRRLADSERDTRGEGRPSGKSREGNGATRERASPEPRRRSLSSGLADSVQPRWTEGRSVAGSGPASGGGSTFGMGDADEPGPQGRIIGRDGGSQWASGSASLVCLDGRSRRIPTEPRFQPLAHGVPARVGRLRAYGNAIVPQLGAVFVRAFMESRP